MLNRPPRLPTSLARALLGGFTCKNRRNRSCHEKTRSGVQASPAIRGQGHQLPAMATKRKTPFGPPWGAVRPAITGSARAGEGVNMTRY